MTFTQNLGRTFFSFFNCMFLIHIVFLTFLKFFIFSLIFLLVENLTSSSSSGHRWSLELFMWCAICSWLGNGLLSHHHLHHLHHWIYLTWNGSWSFMLVEAILVIAFITKFAVWMDIDTSISVGAFWKEFAIFNWMKEGTILFRTSRIEPASYLLSTWWCSSCYTTLRLLKFLLLYFRIIIPESLSSLLPI